MSDIFVTGDTRTKLVQLSINEEPFVISPSSAVTAQIVSKDKSKVLSSASTICEDDMPGAAWATSLVAVKFPRETTAAIKVTGEEISANLEIQVTIDPAGEPEDITFYIPIKIIKGNLP
jgi:hypothetical protein